MKIRCICLLFVTSLVILVLSLAIVSFISKPEKGSPSQYLKTDESRYIDLFLVINDIDYQSNLLSVNANYNFSPELSSILSNVVGDDGNPRYVVQMVVSMPQQISQLTGIVAISGWFFNLDKPNTPQDVQIPIFGKVNMSPFDNYTYAVQIEISGLSDIDNQNLEKLGLKPGSPIETRIGWGDRLNSYSVEATRSSQKVVDLRVASIQENQVDFSIKRNWTDMALGIAIPITLLFLYLLFRTGILSLAIPLIGFVPFRQILVTTGVQGFTLYDIAISSVLAFAVIFHIWANREGNSQVSKPNRQQP